MNALQQAEQLKFLSDQQLQMERGRTPDYLLAAELSRRDQMRKAYQADVAAAQQPKGTVMDELMQSVQPPPMMAPQQQQMQAPPQQAMSIGGMVQRMAQGGMVRYADGGQTGPARDRAGLAAMMGAAPSFSDMLAQAQAAVGQDQLSQYISKLEDEKAKAVVGKPSIWQALMQAGAGMMSSRNPTPLGGIGEGLAQALGRYSQDRDQYRQDQVRLQKQAQENLLTRAQLAEQMNRRNMGIAQLAEGLTQSANSRYNTDASLLQNGLLAEERDKNAMERTRIEQEGMRPGREAQAMLDAIRAKHMQEELDQDKALSAKYGDKIGIAAALAKAQTRPHQMTATDQMNMAAYQDLLKQGMSPSEALSAIAQGKTRKGIEEERLRSSAVQIYKTLLDKDLTAMTDPTKQQSLWQAALTMAAMKSGDKPATQNPQFQYDPKTRKITQIGQ